MTKTYFQTFERDDETEVSVEYSITPYDPGVSHGRPEDCYLPEGGEVGIIDASIGKLKVTLTDDEVKAWSAKIFELHDWSDDGYDDDRDDFRDD